MDHVAERVVRLARVDVVDVGRRERGEMAALLALARLGAAERLPGRGRLRVRGLAAVVVSAIGVAATCGDHQRHADGDHRRQ
jgi:hypothetical protein